MENTIRRFDWYRRVPKDLTESSVHGSLISIAAILFSLYLFVSNLNAYLTVQRESQMLIDNDVRNTKLKINLDVKFGRVPCQLISLDVQDVMGSHELDTAGTLYKIALSKEGATLHKDEIKQQSHSGFHGLSRHNWNLDHIKDEDVVRKALLASEGCRIQGSLEVNKVPGNLHITTHSAGFFLSGFGMNYGVWGRTMGGEDKEKSDKAKAEQAETQKLQQLKNLDISHEILHLSFGEDKDIASVQRDFKGAGILNPLDAKRQQVKYKEYKGPSSGMSDGFWAPQVAVKKDEEAKTWRSLGEWRREWTLESEKALEKVIPQPTIFEYYCNVVPTTYLGLDRRTEHHVYQFTANSNAITSTHMPSIYIRYGLSPVTVQYLDYRAPFFTFLVQTLGIVGGLFTVAGLVESILYRGIQSVQKKFELGKLG